jgi:PleD family two-component response regulator
VRGDGTRFAIVIILRQITLACGSYNLAICQDVSEQRYLVTRLRNELDQERLLARTDPLTSIANIRSFRAELERSIERLSRYGRHFTLISIDLDNFKPINHDYGHAEGGQSAQRCGGYPQVWPS